MKSFVVRAFRVAFDESGFLGVTTQTRPERTQLLELDFGQLRRNGDLVPGQQEPAVIDADEVEQRWLAQDVASITVRHTFVGGWRTRVVLSNLADAPWTATLRLTARAGADVTAWTLATGADGALALLPPDEESPILYGRSGTMPAPIEVADAQTPSAAELDVGPYRLPPGERLVLGWEWATARHPRELAARLARRWPALPRSFTVAAEEEIWLPTDPDSALVLPEQVGALDTGERQGAVALISSVPGRYRIERRSARGSTALDLTWATPVLDFLANAAERALAGPTAPSGVVALPDLASALVVQRVARGSGFGAAEAAEDALDQFTARLGDADDAPAWGAIYLAGEYDRLGDPDLISRARDLLERPEHPVPGLGMALVRTAVATAVAGGSVRSRPTLRNSSSDVGSDDLPALELLLATRPDQVAGSAALYRWGISLSAGLPGRLSGGRVDDLCYAVAVLRLVPEGLLSWWTTRFGSSPAELADVRALELVDRLGPGAAITAAHGWLAISC